MHSIKNQNKLVSYFVVHPNQEKENIFYKFTRNQLSYLFFQLQYYKKMCLEYSQKTNSHIKIFITTR